MAPLALPHCLGLPYWHYQLVLSWYLHRPESHQFSLHKGLRLSQWERTGPIDRTPGTPGSDKNISMSMFCELLSSPSWSLSLSVINVEFMISLQDWKKIIDGGMEELLQQYNADPEDKVPVQYIGPQVKQAKNTKQTTTTKCCKKCIWLDPALAIKASRLHSRSAFLLLQWERCEYDSIPHCDTRNGVDLFSHK